MIWPAQGWAETVLVWSPSLALSLGRAEQQVKRRRKAPCRKLMFSLTFQAPNELQDLRYLKQRKELGLLDTLRISAQLAVWPWVSHILSLSHCFFICKIRRVTSIGEVTRIQWEKEGGLN